MKRKKKKTPNTIPSGCTVFDKCLGKIVNGEIINFVGDRSTGKTLMVAELIAAARRKYGDQVKWFYDDAEAGFTFNTKEMYGFEMLTEEQRERSSDTIEEFELNFEKEINNIKKGEILIYVLDSFDGLNSEAGKKRYKKKLKVMSGEEEEGKGSFKLEKTTEFGEFFRQRKIDIRNKKILLVVVSQVRMNIGVTFGKKYYRTGGKALDHYAHQIIWFAEAERQTRIHKGRKRVTGITIKAKVDKNKEAPPFRECFINILFDYGVDNVTSNIDYYYNLRDEKGKLKKDKAKKLKWGGKEYSRKGLISYIEENNQEGELEELVRTSWDETEKALSSKERKKKY